MPSVNPDLARTYDFAGVQSWNGAKINEQLDAVIARVNALVTALQESLNAEDQLTNGLVLVENLHDETKALLEGLEAAEFALWESYAHAHANKTLLDTIEAADVHAHDNAAVLAALTAAGSGSVITTTERAKLAGIAAGADARWVEVPTSAYTATPLDTQRIAMSDTSHVATAWPVRYTIGGTRYYGVVDIVIANSQVTIAGAPLSGDITQLDVGRPELVVQMPIHVPGKYGAELGGLLFDMRALLQWMAPPAYLVAMKARHLVPDSGGTPADQPQINATHDSSDVFTTPITMDVAWQGSGAVDTTEYRFEPGDDIEVACKRVASTPDAADLTVFLTWVLE